MARTIYFSNQNFRFSHIDGNHPFTPDGPGFNCAVLTRLYLLLGSSKSELSTMYELEISQLVFLLKCVT